MYLGSLIAVSCCRKTSLALIVPSSPPLRCAIPFLSNSGFLFVYTFGPWLRHGRVGIDVGTWYATPGRRWNLIPGGMWYVCSSAFHPSVHPFTLVFEVLHLVSLSLAGVRINLNLIPTHPDQAAGLAFVGSSAYAFGSILFAQGAMLVSLIASRVLYRGENLLSFKLQAGALWPAGSARCRT